MWVESQHIKKIHLMIKDCANLMQLLVRKNGFGQGIVREKSGIFYFSSLRER